MRVYIITINRIAMHYNFVPTEGGCDWQNLKILCGNELDEICAMDNLKITFSVIKWDTLWSHTRCHDNVGFEKKLETFCHIT